MSFRINEPFNTISHALGALTSLAGLITLLIHAEGSDSTVAYWIYGLSLIFLYFISTLYHAHDWSENISQSLQKLDRTAIAFLIAGTATPIGLLKLNNFYASLLLGAFWGIFAFIVISHLSLPSFPWWLYVGVYVGMGWLALLMIKPLLASLSVGGVSWLVVGGVFYTLGALIYSLDWPRISDVWFGAHELWHVFCLLGSVAHYILILGYTT
ncbi:MAG: hemolysin III family protein [bacterium]